MQELSRLLDFFAKQLCRRAFATDDDDLPEQDILQETSKLVALTTRLCRLQDARQKDFDDPKVIMRTILTYQALTREIWKEEFKYREFKQKLNAKNAEAAPSGGIATQPPPEGETPTSGQCGRHDNVTCKPTRHCTSLPKSSRRRRHFAGRRVNGKKPCVPTAMRRHSASPSRLAFLAKITLNDSPLQKQSSRRRNIANLQATWRIDRNLHRSRPPPLACHLTT